MPRGLPQNVKDNLHKCRSAAIAAVSSYNSPDLTFKSYLFVVLIIISWNALFHAIFYKKRKKPWYRKRNSQRFIYIDGDPKHWELSECLSQYFKEKNPPERKNIEFLIGLRNKIEHRVLPELDPTLFGECQASLMNLEDILVQEFGSRYSLAQKLTVSLQFSRVSPPEKKAAIKRLASSEAKNIVEYIEKFRNGLADCILDDQRYSFNAFLVPKVSNRGNVADAAIEFIHSKDLNDKELARLKKLNILIKEKKIPIVNLDYYRPGEVVQKLIEKVPYKITMQTHTDAWRYYKVRPLGNSREKENTRPEYCVFNKTHNDYLYTDAWVEKLIEALSDLNKYKEITGRNPIGGDS